MNTITTRKVQPQGVRKIFCPTKGCNELMVKVYPWASLTIQGQVKPCAKCINKALKIEKQLGLSLTK